MKSFKPLIQFLLFALALSLSAGIANAQSNNYQMKYRNLDTNNDGMVSRAEWRGNNRSFQNHDWNRDGILSGNEVTPGAKRNVYNNDYYPNNRDDNSFVNLDYNRDNYISKNEWRGEQGAFERRDCDRDSYLSRNEFLTATECNTTVDYGTFSNLDNDNNGYLSRKEWRESVTVFVSKDCNRDNRVSRVEYFTQDCASGTCDFDCLFRELDVNNNGMVSRSEWRGDSQAFNQLDQNRSDGLSRSELSYNNQNRQGTTQQVLDTVSDTINRFLGQ